MGLDSTVLFVGDQPQFFFDDAVVEVADHLTRTIHRPVPDERSPLISRDRPWEHVTYFSCNSWNLRRDADSGRFHCFYTDFKMDRERLWNRGGGSHGWENARMRQLYARSEDGIEWVKPPMGIQHEDGHDTNIVFGTEDYGSVYDIFIVDDPLERDPRRRFKTLYTRIVPVDENESRFTVHAAYSADGIHLTPSDEGPVFGRLGRERGDVTIMAFDPDSRTHIAATRHPFYRSVPGRGHLRPPPAARPGVGGEPGFDAALGSATRQGRRRIFLIESRDFLRWSEPRPILAPDPALDNIDDAFYGMTPLRLGGQWVGFLNVFHMVSNTMDVQLVHSRDGRAWHRVAPGRAWLQRGEPGSWNEFMVTVPSPPVAMGDELWVYHGGSKNHHDWWFAGGNEARDHPDAWRDVPEVWDWDAVGYGLGLARLRRDGFVSLGANPVREGVLVTQPLLSWGDTLTVNAACRGHGSLRAEILDEAGAVIPGYTAEDCDPFHGDSVEHVLRWNGGAELRGGAAAGDGEGEAEAPRFRRIRFLLRDAELYSFRLGGGAGF